MNFIFFNWWHNEKSSVNIDCENVMVLTKRSIEIQLVVNVWWSGQSSMKKSEQLSTITSSSSSSLSLSPKRKKCLFNVLSFFIIETKWKTFEINCFTLEMWKMLMSFSTKKKKKRKTRINEWNTFEVQSQMKCVVWLCHERHSTIFFMFHIHHLLFRYFAHQQHFQQQFNQHQKFFRLY